MDTTPLDALKIDPRQTRLFVPDELVDFKRRLFERVAKSTGGAVYDVRTLKNYPDDIIPIVGCSTYLRPIVLKWMHYGRPFIYWDRGYMRRCFATWLPRGSHGGYYRWHLNAFQMTKIYDVPPDRFKKLNIETMSWRGPGEHIVVAAPPPNYEIYHGIEDWTERTVKTLETLTKRPIKVRYKSDTRPLWADLEGAHALVTHGSITAVEAVVMGCPVFVHPDSAAAPVGRTRLEDIESPIRPDREKWLASLAYCQYNEAEVVRGDVWRMIR